MAELRCIQEAHVRRHKGQSGACECGVGTVAVRGGAKQWRREAVR